ncbi:hypothetical protein AB0H71_29520 [Nocardia sp. NPDC050697]|uniref:hypothetical protein n=1 Tax=Nocardia sp. NPDC050697 TaxID=3155158 RepID=UPI0033D58D58
MFATSSPRKALIRLAVAGALAAAPVIALAAPAAADSAAGPVVTEVRHHRNDPWRDPFARNPFQQCNWWDQNAPWWERCDYNPWNNNNPWNNPWQRPFANNFGPGTFGSS